MNEYNSIEELNEEYYRQFAELSHNDEDMPDEAVELIAKDLIQAYKKERELFRGEESIDIEKALFELRYRLKYCVPRKGWFFWNRLAKKLLKIYKTTREMDIDEVIAEMELLRSQRKNKQKERKLKKKQAKKVTKQVEMLPTADKSQLAAASEETTDNAVATTEQSD